jgi:hypothetical protein
MKVCLGLLLSVGFPVCFPLLAGEAIPTYQIWTHALVGYARGGAGFAFSPQQEITVTALGYDDDDLSLGSETVSLLDSNGLQLASVLVTSNSPRFHWTRYETIAAIRLPAGEMFYLRACASNNVWTGRVVLAEGPYQNGTFSVGLDLNYLAAVAGTNADGTFPAEQQPS